MKPLSEVQPFWMVYVFGQRGPARRHDTRSEAHKEAERLASITPDVTVAVLEVTDLVRRNTLERHSFDTGHPAAPQAWGKKPDGLDDDMPF